MAGFMSFNLGEVPQPPPEEPGPEELSRVDDEDQNEVRRPGFK